MGEVIYLTRRTPKSRFDLPIANMNITPLIDVMLVLIVMLILALPATMHQASIELPQKGTPLKEKPAVQNLLVSSDGVYHWNGVAVDDSALAAQLRGLVAAGDELRIETDGFARYERFNHLIAMVKEARVEKLGFVGNHRYRNWDQPV